MTVARVSDAVIRLHGACPIDDAETLLQLLSDLPDAGVDWRDCGDAHAAVIQVLMAAGRKLHGPPAGAVPRLIATSLPVALLSPK